MSARRRAARLLAVLVLVTAASTGSAHAEGQVAVSADRSTWLAGLSGPLFDPAERWIPGDVRSSTFYVRNQAQEAGTLAIEVTTADGDALVAHHDVTLAVRRDQGAWVTLPADGRPHALAEPLAAAADARIDVRASFTPSSPNRSQTARLDLDLQVLLTRADLVAGPTDGPDGDGPGGLLPDTGGVERAVLVLGGVLMLIGSVIVFGASRSRREEGKQ